MLSLFSLKKLTSNLNLSKGPNTLSLSNGFTIVELLVVIVVIGILATITIVSYAGIANKAATASLQSDLSNASKQLKLFQVTEASGNYPTANKCPTPGTTEICLKASNGNTYTYTPNNTSNPKTFTLKATNGTNIYQITNDSSPTIASASLAVTDPANWLAVGTQVWAKTNLNVGTMVTGVTTQTNNSILEKYCSNNTESNCTTYGGLYQWDEAMQYVITNGAQGICPTGSHIPTDTEWTTLETYLDPVTAGTQLQPGGSSGLNMPLAGFRFIEGSFLPLSWMASLWSSSSESTNTELNYTAAWDLDLESGLATVYHGLYVKDSGYSVRCIGN